MHEEEITQWAERIQGIPAMPPLYADNCFVVILLVGMLLFVTALSDRGRLLSNMLEKFFLPRKKIEEGVKTTGSLYIQFGLFANSFITTALFLTIYIVRRDNYEVANCFRLLLMLTIAIAAAFALKQGIYRAVNWVFSDKSRILLWQHCYSHWAIISGISMYALSAATVFFNLCSTTMTILLVAHIIGAEICLFYRAFHIFLTKKHGSLQLFVYLCALEIMPLLLAGKALTQFL